MEWTLTITGIDLGRSIPTEDELQPHDHPIESWAAQRVYGTLSTLLTLAQEQRADALVEKQTASSPERHATADALLSHAELDIALAKFLRENFTLTREQE
jgi:hypothetical protein